MNPIELSQFNIVNGELVAFGSVFELFESTGELIDTLLSFQLAVKKANKIAIERTGKKGIFIVNFNNITTYSYLDVDQLTVARLIIKTRETS